MHKLYLTCLVLVSTLIVMFLAVNWVQTYPRVDGVIECDNNDFKLC
jgi:hypothetical protein